MTVEIVSIGTELLLGQIVDTNAAWLSARLAEIGVGVYRRTTVGDNRERIIRALQEALDARRRRHHDWRAGTDRRRPHARGDCRRAG
jgi:molybdopterin-biosynthesis enzyme MoeA-like protein